MDGLWQQCHGIGWGDGQAEIGTGQRLGGQIAQSVAELHAKVHARHLVHHLGHGAHHLAGLFRHGVQLSIIHVLCHRGDHALPRRHGLFQPLLGIPSLGRAGGGGQIGGVIKPELRQADGFLYSLGIVRAYRLGLRDLLQGDALSHVVIDWAGVFRRVHGRAHAG